MKMKIIFIMINKDWISTFNKLGYRLTAPREAVISALLESIRVLSPTELFFAAHSNCSSLGLVTVYRTLDKLEEMGLVQRVYLMDGSFGYFPSSDSHRHMLVCENCHRVEFFSGDDLSTLMVDVSQKSGFEVRDHWLQLTGLCSECRV
jgi:Fur family ferric uptake transcriptional regulator